MNATVAPDYSTYDNELAKRILPMRFRHIGNPFAFLNDVGIVPILEFIYKGNLLQDVAEVLNVSFTVLRGWVENEGHGPAIEEAERVSAEGFLAEAQRRLRCAKNGFELAQAKEMVRHAQFMASKKNKGTYGGSDALGGSGGSVSYVFNINGNTTEPAAVKEIIGKVIEETVDVPQVHFNPLAHLLVDDEVEEIPFDENTPIGEMTFDEDEAEIGPFHES